MTIDRILLAGGTLVPVEGAPAPGDLLVEGGRIAALGAIPPGRAAGARVLDCRGCAVLPGLIQVHVHLCQALMRNLADDLELLDWLTHRIWPLEAAHDADTLGLSARLGVAELLAGGTTTILDMGTVHHTDAVMQAIQEGGIRAACGKAMMDTGNTVPSRLLERTADSLRETEGLIQRWHGAEGGRIRYALSPRFFLSCSDALLEGVADLAARRELLVHTHAAENRRETELVRRRAGTGNVWALERRGLVGRRTCLAHCIWLEEGEPGLLARAGASVAHCPSANLKLASGTCDVVRLQSAGVRVGIGADGAPCNNRMDAFQEMRQAALLAKPLHGPTALDASTALRMATLDGAHILGLEDQVGSLRRGKEADIIAVDLQTLHAQPAPDPVSALVYAARASDVRHTLVAGRVVVEAGKLQTLDASALAAVAPEGARRLLQRAGLSA